MSSQISATYLPKSFLSGFDQVTNILQQMKLPFEVIKIVFEYLSVTYLESIGANLKQLIFYSKNVTFKSLKKQLIEINGRYEIKHNGIVITSNVDCCTKRALLVRL